MIAMLLSPLLPALQGFSPSLGGFPSQSPEAKASSARYAFNRATWGYLTTIQASLPVAEVASFSDGLANASTGRLWFYMMDAPVESSQGYPAAITVSEASYNATCGFDGTLLDPEDPRCAKVRVRVRVGVGVGVRVRVGVRVGVEVGVGVRVRAVGEVKCLLDAVAVVDVDIDVQHARVHLG